MALSLALLDQLASAQSGVLSLQVLAEFFVIATREIAEPLTIVQAEERTLNYLQGWRTLPVTNLVFREAVRGVREHRMNFRDAQIWATARLNQVHTVLSEDFGHDTEVEGVRFLNPFDRSFELSRV
jgi:predicted nucleic acid-binding protein